MTRLKRASSRIMKKPDNEPVYNFSFQQLSKFDDLPSRSKMVRWLKKALTQDAVMTIRFVEEEEGKQLNAQFRKKDYATNILTFDYVREPVVEADLVVCVPVLRKEAKEQNKTLEEHLAHLLVHGALHALGYDHMNDDEATVMEKKETEIVMDLGFQPPYPDRNYV